MKNFIFLSAMLATSLAANAQILQVAASAQRANLYGQTLKTVEKPANLNVKQFVSAPNRAIEDGVVYARPVGVYYSAYTFGTEGEIGAWLVPGTGTVTYPNVCQNPEQATWSIATSNGYNDLNKYTNVNKDLEMPWGINPYLDTKDRLLVAMNSPIISVGNTSFEVPYVQAVANEVSPMSNVNPTRGISIRFSNTDAPAYGSGGSYEAMVQEQVSDIVKVHGVIETFDKPVSPMYVESVDLPFFTYQEDPLNGKELTIKIYPLGESGQIIREAKEVLTCNSAEILRAQTDNQGRTFWQCIGSFSKKTQDEFGDEIADPFTIDYPYAVEISGYNQEGVDVELYLTRVEDAYELACDNQTSVSCEMSDGSFAYYFVKGEMTPIEFNMFYDGVELLISSKGDSYGSVVVSDDGQTVVTDNPNMEEANKVNYVPFSSAASFFAYDENGEVVGQNYDIEGMPDWLKVDGVADDPREKSGYSAIFFKAEPLPAGTEGRYATIYIVGRGGVKNAQPITVRQGSVTGIGTVIAEGDANAIYYNVSGQRVNNAKGLVISKAGKRIIK